MSGYVPIVGCHAGWWSRGRILSHGWTRSRRNPLQRIVVDVVLVVAVGAGGAEGARVLARGRTLVEGRIMRGRPIRVHISALVGIGKDGRLRGGGG